MTNDGVVHVERRLEAPPDAVFRAWTDPGRMGEWLSPMGHAEAEADVRVGGSFTIVMVGDGQRIEHTGEYLEVDPPRRLVFTWASPYTGPGRTVVTVTLEADGDGTNLTLVHEGLSPEAAESHAGGWETIVGRLDEHLARV